MKGEPTKRIKKIKESQVDLDLLKELENKDKSNNYYKGKND